MRGPVRKLLDFIPLARGKKLPSREEMLKAHPSRNESLRWFKEDGEVNLFIPRRPGRFGDVAGKLFRLPPEKQVVLDQVGSGVWELCDGFHTVESILDYIQRRHKLSRREAEVSVTAYLKILGQRGLIGLRAAGNKSGKWKRKRKT